MADTSKLTASAAKAAADLDTLLAAQSSDQPAVDAAQQTLDAMDAKIVAATPKPPTA